MASERSEHYFKSASSENMFFGEKDVTWNMKLKIFLFSGFSRNIRFSKITELKPNLYYTKWTKLNIINFQSEIFFTENETHLKDKNQFK